MDQTGTPMAVVLAVGGQPGDAHRSAALAAIVRRRHGGQRAVAGDRGAGGAAVQPPRRRAPAPAGRAVDRLHAEEGGAAATGRPRHRRAPRRRHRRRRRRVRVRRRLRRSRCRPRCSRCCSACPSRTGIGWRAGRRPSPSPSARRCRRSTWHGSSRRRPRCAPTATSGSPPPERRPATTSSPGCVEAEVDGHRLSDDDVIAMITGFVFAGAETTRRQLTAAVQLLAEHPDDWERLAAEPELIPNAVEEILRHRGIVSGLTRRAEEPFERDDLARARGRAPPPVLRRRQPRPRPLRGRRRVRGRPPRRPRPRHLRLGTAPLRRRRSRPTRAAPRASAC